MKLLNNCLCLVFVRFLSKWVLKNKSEKINNKHSGYTDAVTLVAVLYVG